MFFLYLHCVTRAKGRADGTKTFPTLEKNFLKTPNQNIQFQQVSQRQMGLPIPGHFLREREPTRIGSTMHGLCSLLCSSGPLNVWNVSFHLAAMCTPHTFVMGEALQSCGRHCRNSARGATGTGDRTAPVTALQTGISWGCGTWGRDKVLVALFCH